MNTNRPIAIDCLATPPDSDPRKEGDRGTGQSSASTVNRASHVTSPVACRQIQEVFDLFSRHNNSIPTRWPHALGCRPAMSPPTSPKSLCPERVGSHAKARQATADNEHSGADPRRAEESWWVPHTCDSGNTLQPSIEDYQSSSARSLEGATSTNLSQSEEMQPPRPDLPAPGHGQTWNDIAVFNNQQVLFRSVEALCTTAARNFWLSQSNCALDRPFSAFENRQCLHRYRYHPYSASRRCPQAHQQATGLAAYLIRIANMIWERALRAGDHAQELDAVYRMGNLYHWGNRVAMATRGDLGLMNKDSVFSIMLEATQMATYLLHDGMRSQIMELWTEWEAWIDPRNQVVNGGVV